MKICLNAAKCTGHGICEAIAPEVFPEVFEVGDDGLVRVLIEHPSQERRAEIEDAVDQCPAQALAIED